jgi:hypothetical protein
MIGYGKQKDSERGRKQKGTLWGLALVLVIIIGSQHAAARAPSPANEQGNLRITLRMYNYGVSRGLLLRAEGEASIILNQAGLEAVWVDCPLVEADLDDYPACPQTLGRTDFSLRVITAKDADLVSSHHEALGQALECAAGEVGCSAYVFYRDVLALARQGDAAEYQLLGHALAHEIGHLLLGPNSHSAAGIMRGKWNERDLQAIARAYLFFTDAQSEQLREDVAARSAMEQDQLAKARKP